MALLAGGHILLEGPPGTAKTLLVRALSIAVRGEFRDAQCGEGVLHVADRIDAEVGRAARRDDGGLESERSVWRSRRRGEGGGRAVIRRERRGGRQRERQGRALRLLGLVLHHQLVGWRHRQRARALGGKASCARAVWWHVRARRQRSQQLTDQRTYPWPGLRGACCFWRSWCERGWLAVPSWRAAWTPLRLAAGPRPARAGGREGSGVGVRGKRAA